MLKISVCDDQEDCLAEITELLEKYFRSRPQLAGGVKAFSRGSELLLNVKQGEYFDICILDILMPEQDGIDIGKRLRSIGNAGELIFLTNSNDYAADSYDLHAFYYLLKPVDESKLFQVLDNAADKLTKREEKAILFETRNGSRRLSYEKIIYAERAGRVMRCHCTDGIVDSQTLRKPFHEVAAPLLADSRFYLCGASYVLNFRHVSGVKGREALLDDGNTIYLPRSVASEFKRVWGNYWLGESSAW